MQGIPCIAHCLLSLHSFPCSSQTARQHATTSTTSTAHMHFSFGVLSHHGFWHTSTTPHFQASSLGLPAFTEAFKICVQVAEDYVHEDAFYFPHNLDFRGRAYPMHPNLNHLGADLSRGLLQFADAKPLGPDGLRWLEISVSNITIYLWYWEWCHSCCNSSVYVAGLAHPGTYVICC